METNGNINLKIEDYECALCLKLLVNPCSTPCGHSFCQFCLQRSIDAHFRSSGNGLGPLVCPLCRSPCLQSLYDNNSQHILKPNVLLSQLLQNLFPNEYRSRLEEVRHDVEEYERTVILDKKIYIGNRHKLRSREHGDNIHEWTFFVRMDNNEETEKYIDKVAIHLHPTFKPSVIHLNRAPFEIKRLGWGYFQIRCQVHWKQIYHKPPQIFTWMLSFNGEGDFSSHDVQFTARNQPLKPIVIEDIDDEEENEVYSNEEEEEYGSEEDEDEEDVEYIEELDEN